MRLGRIKQLNDTPPDPPLLGATMRRVSLVQDRMREQYIKGLQDGSEEVLRRLIGKHAEGPETVSPETAEWARACLERLAVPLERSEVTDA